MPKAVLTEAKVEAELKKRDGNYAAVARACGVTRQAVQGFVARHPGLAAAAIDVREGMKDEVESALYEAAKRGEPWAVCFYLKCQAKDRGYVERQETKDVSDDDIDRALDAELADIRRNGQAAGPDPAPGASPA
jgi:hypothetical protein